MADLPTEETKAAKSAHAEREERILAFWKEKDIFNKSLISSGTWAAQQENQWASAFGDLFSVPPMGVYDDVAQSGLKVAGAIAVALFVLNFLCLGI